MSVYVSRTLETLTQILRKSLFASHIIKSRCDAKNDSRWVVGSFASNGVEKVTHMTNLICVKHSYSAIHMAGFHDLLRIIRGCDANTFSSNMMTWIPTNDCIACFVGVTHMRTLGSQPIQSFVSSSA